MRFWRPALMPTLAALPAIAGAGALLAACGGSEPTSVAATAHTGLCSTIELVDDDQADRARAEFVDEVHTPLHDLAAATADVDRAGAARLLEAKEAVESAWEATQPPTRAALDELDRTVRDAARVVERLDLAPCRP